MSRSEVAAAGSAGQALVDMGTRYPLMVFSGNSVDYLIVSLAVMTAGVPAVSVSTGYSLRSADHGRIRRSRRPWTLRPRNADADSNTSVRALMNNPGRCAGWT